MKVSEVNLPVLKDYCGISDDDSDEILVALMVAANSFIQSHTGLSAEEIDEHEDITYAYMVLVNDMYTSREYDKLSSKMSPQPNRTVETILSMHTKAEVYVGWSD